MKFSARANIRRRTERGVLARPEKVRSRNKKSVVALPKRCYFSVVVSVIVGCVILMYFLVVRNISL